MKRFVTIILFFVCFAAVAQENSFEALDEVQLYSHFSSNYQVGNSYISLSDSILKNKSGNLTDLLNKYANVYMKVQGKGMVSSVSVRGSSAAHTAVFWNGIPINSSLNGQTDFNTVYTAIYNKISIRKGGGSVMLGSGAIGGALNLENKLYFGNKTAGYIQASIGSFDTYTSTLQMDHSTEKMALQVGIIGNTSKNDYAYYNSDLKNENGEIKHYSLLLNTGYKFDHANSLYMKAVLNNSDRNTSGTLTTTSNANMDHQNQSVLVGWINNSKKFDSELKTAYLKEIYTFTYSKETPNYFSENSSNKFFSNYNFDYHLNQNVLLTSGVSYEYLLGEGTDLQGSKRQKIAFFTSFHHVLSEKFKYNISVREEWSSDFKIPFVFSFDTKYQWHKKHAVGFNVSTNYRLPTLNDLFWQPGGNPNLKPEQNLSSEIGYEWINTYFKLGVNVFSSRSTDLIQWRSITDIFWQPINIQKVNSNGLELSIVGSKEIKQGKINTQLAYSFTDSTNSDTQNQLIYVPKHAGNFLISYSYKNWFLELNEHYIGEVFTTSSNTSSLDDYLLSNVTIQREFYNNKLKFGLTINNLFNTDYEIVKSRPMPNRNLNFLINYKF